MALPDGRSLLQRLRSQDYELPVLFLTPKESATGRIAGGDDYVRKPFALEDILARLRGLVRRSSLVATGNADARMSIEDLTLDEERFEVTRAGTTMDLSPTEFGLLRFLMRNFNRVVSKAEILERVWDYESRGKEATVGL